MDQKVPILLLSLLWIQETSANPLSEEIVQKKNDIKAQQEARSLLAEINVKGCVCFEQKPEKSSTSLTQKLMVFVDFSMLEASLKSLFQDLQKIGRRLIFKGLFNDSFAQTKAKLQHLGISVEIDPQVFETYGIVSVTYLVRSHELKKSWDVMKGNISVNRALKIFASLRPK